MAYTDRNKLTRSYPVLLTAIHFSAIYLSHSFSVTAWYSQFPPYSQESPKNAPITSDIANTLQFPSAANVIKHPMNVPGQKSNHSDFAMMHITNIMICTVICIFHDLHQMACSKSVCSKAHEFLRVEWADSTRCFYLHTFSNMTAICPRVCLCTSCHK